MVFWVHISQQLDEWLAAILGIRFSDGVMNGMD